MSVRDRARLFGGTVGGGGGGGFKGPSILKKLLRQNRTRRGPPSRSAPAIPSKKGTVVTPESKNGVELNEIKNGVEVDEKHLDPERARSGTRSASRSRSGTRARSGSRARSGTRSRRGPPPRRDHLPNPAHSATIGVRAPVPISIRERIMLLTGKRGPPPRRGGNRPTPPPNSQQPSNQVVQQRLSALQQVTSSSNRRGSLSQQVNTDAVIDRLKHEDGAEDGLNFGVKDVQIGDGDEEEMDGLSLRSGRNFADYATLEEELEMNHMSSGDLDRLAVRHYETEGDADMQRMLRINKTITEEERMQRALLFIDEAKNNREPRTRRMQKCPIRVYLLRFNPIYLTTLRVIIWIHMLLSVWEPATNNSNNIYDGGYYNSSDYEFCQVMELLIILVYWADSLLDVYQKGRFFVRSVKLDINLALNVLFTIDYAMFVHHGSPYMRFSRMLRPIKLVLASRRIRRTLRAIVATLPKILEVVLLILVFIVVFGVGAVAMFYDKYAESPEQAQERNNFERVIRGYAPITNSTIPAIHSQQENFDTLGNAAVSLFILLSTENWPDIGRSAYAENGLSALFFITFLVGVMLVVMSVPVSVLFEAFKEYRRTQVIEDRMRERKALWAAFQTLDVNNTGELPYDVVETLLATLLKIEDKRVLRVFFEMMDDNNDGTIEVFEFFRVCELLLFTVTVGDDVVVQCMDPMLSCLCFCCEDRRSGCEMMVASCTRGCDRKRRRCSKKLSLRPMVLSRAFNAVMLALVIFNFINMSLFKHRMSDKRRDTIFWFNQVFSIIFLLECVLKVVALSWARYWKVSWYRFELILAFMIMWPEWILPMVGVDVGRSASVVRALRFIRIFPLISAVWPRFRGLSGVVSKMATVIPRLFDTYAIIILFIYVYSILGLEIFFTSFEAANPGCQTFPDIKCIDPMVNFLGFSEAALAMFQVFTTSNWNALLHDLWIIGELRVSNNWYVSTIFLSSFYFISVLILTNLIIALVWEVFSVVAQHEAKSEAEAGLDEEEDYEGYSDEDSADDIDGEPTGVSATNTFRRKAKARIQKKVDLNSWEDSIYLGKGDLDQATKTLVQNKSSVPLDEGLSIATMASPSNGSAPVAKQKASTDPSATIVEGPNGGSPTDIQERRKDRMKNKSMMSGSFQVNLNDFDVSGASGAKKKKSEKRVPTGFNKKIAGLAGMAAASLAADDDNGNDEGDLDSDDDTEEPADLDDVTINVTPVPASRRPPPRAAPFAPPPRRSAGPPNRAPPTRRAPPPRFPPKKPSN